MSLNVFGAPRTSRESVGVRTNLASEKDREFETAFHTCGIWYLISHINHACLSNCRRSFIGDMQIIRAARDMDEGTELFFWYQMPVSFQSYSEAQKKLRHWGFTCGCDICLERKSVPKALVAKRTALKHELQGIIGNTPERISFAKALKAIQQLEQTYAATAMKPGDVTFDLWEVYFAVSQGYSEKGNRPEAIDMILKGLEALGFVITACPRRGTAKLKKTELTIVRWGVASDLAVIAFINLAQAYMGVAPELSAAARKYAEIAYTIVVGEKETFLDTYPELK